MASDGSEHVKCHTYHDFMGGWYVKLDNAWASRLSVLQQGGQYEFFIWDEEYENAQKVMTIFAFSGQNREEQSRQEDQFILLKTDSVIYAAKIYPISAKYNITQETVVLNFQLIHHDWKTGEI